jgi:hypothetical protein
MLVILPIAMLVLINSLSQLTNEAFENETATTTTTSPVTAGIVSLMRKPRDMVAWFDHHRKMGIARFYIRLEDAGENSLEELYFRTYPDDIYYERGDSDINQDNYKTLQDRQATFVNRMLHKAMEDGTGVLFHIDADELLDGDLQFLQSLPEGTKTLRYENIEAVYDRDGAGTKCFDTQTFIRCASHNGYLCTAYGNGKGAGIVAPDVELDGAHVFKYKGSTEGDFVYNVPFDVLRVKHFDSCTFADWADKFHNLMGSTTDSIPFDYYKDSVDAIKQAHEIYDKYKQRDIASFPEDAVVTTTATEANVGIEA